MNPKEIKVRERGLESSGKGKEEVVGFCEMQFVSQLTERSNCFPRKTLVHGVPYLP